MAPGRSFESELDTLQKIETYGSLSVAYLKTIIKGGGLLLDVGCGRGTNSKYWDGGYIGIDPNPPLNVNLKNGRFVVGTLASFFEKEKPSKIDAILWCHSLEHTENPLLNLQLSRSVIKEKGTILVCVPHADSPWAYEYDGHLFIFNEVILKRLLNRCGFSIHSSLTITLREDKKELWVAGVAI